MTKIVFLLCVFLLLASCLWRIANAELASTNREDDLQVSDTIDPNSNTDLIGDFLIRRNRASHPRQQLDLNTLAILGENDEMTSTLDAAGVVADANDDLVPTIRKERNLLKGLPLPTADLITELLLTLNNLLAKFDVTVVLLPAPFPVRLARCIPGCLQNPDCRGAVTNDGYGGQGQGGHSSPLDAVLGLLKIGGL